MCSGNNIIGEPPEPPNDQMTHGKLGIHNKKGNNKTQPHYGGKGRPIINNDPTRTHRGHYIKLRSNYRYTAHP